jgi:cytoskeletal protein CcmA (bactofilin family)
MSDPIKKTIIAPGVIVQGNITGEGDLEIHGRVNGDIKTPGAINLSETGHVEGRADCGKISIGGYLKGEVNAAVSVDIGTAGLVIGKIKTPRFKLEDGASVQADVEMPMTENHRARGFPESAPKTQPVATLTDSAPATL